MIVRKALALLAALLISGCASSPASFQPPARVEIVKVPIYMPCPAVVVHKPEMFFDNTATEGMLLFEKVKLLLAQNYVLKAYSKELEASLAACTNTSLN